MSYVYFKLVHIFSHLRARKMFLHFELIIQELIQKFDFLPIAAENSCQKTAKILN